MEYWILGSGECGKVPRHGGRLVLPLQFGPTDERDVDVRVWVPTARTQVGYTAPWMEIASEPGMEGVDGRVFVLKVRTAELPGPGEYFEVVRLGGRTLGVLVQLANGPA